MLIAAPLVFLCGTADGGAIPSSFLNDGEATRRCARQSWTNNTLQVHKRDDHQRVVDQKFFEPGDRVIALGSYTGRAKAAGKEFTARFAHVWTLQGGKIVRLQQCRDTVQVTRALAR